MLSVSLCSGKKLLGRSQTRSVAEKRREKLNDYCRVSRVRVAEVDTID